MHFGWRGCDEHQCVCLGDFTVATDTDGIDYVEFSTERGTKTRTSAGWEKNHPFKPKMYATRGDRCPVKHFTRYMSLRTKHTPVHVHLLQTLHSTWQLLINQAIIFGTKINP